MEQAEAAMANSIIEIPLPDGVQASTAEVELLKVTFQAFLRLRCADCERQKELMQGIEECGWKVHCGLSWVAEARRGSDYEQATGETMDDALSSLYHLTRMAKLEGCP